MANEARATEVSIRELRNHTKSVIDRIEAGDSVYLTRRGERIATIAPLRVPTWAEHVADVLDGEPYDSALAELLDDDDLVSAAFDDGARRGPATARPQA